MRVFLRQIDRAQAGVKEVEVGAPGGLGISVKVGGAEFSIQQAQDGDDGIQIRLTNAADGKSMIAIEPQAANTVVIRGRK